MEKCQFLLPFLWTQPEVQTETKVYKQKTLFLSQPGWCQRLDDGWELKPTRGPMKPSRWLLSPQHYRLWLHLKYYLGGEHGPQECDASVPHSPWIDKIVTLTNVNSMENHMEKKLGTENTQWRGEQEAIWWENTTTKGDVRKYLTGQKEQRRRNACKGLSLIFAGLCMFSTLLLDYGPICIPLMKYIWCSGQTQQLLQCL